MKPRVDLTKLTSIDRIDCGDAEEAALLKGMAERAVRYLRKHGWCPPIDRVYFGCGVGGVVAVFLCHFSEPVRGKDEWLWVVEGDVPSVYLVLDQAPDPASALETYCQLMDEWISAVLGGRSLEGAFPVEAKSTPENANNLRSRLRFIRTRLLPDWQAVWGSRPDKGGRPG